MPDPIPALLAVIAVLAVAWLVAMSAAVVLYSDVRHWRWAAAAWRHRCNEMRRSAVAFRR